MTERLTVPVGGASTVLVRQLAAISGELDALLEEMRVETDGYGLLPEQSALLRLISGASVRPAEDVGMSIIGARLVVAVLPPTHARRVLNQPSRDLISVRPAPDHVATLVRGTPQRAGDDRGRRAASQVAAAVMRESGEALVAISAPLLTPDDVAVAYKDATEAAELLSGAGSRPVFVDECWASLATIRLRRQLARALPAGNPLERLREYDAQHGSDFARTLGMWLAKNGDTTATSTALSLHPNTLRYRLRRVGEIAGIDLCDPDVRVLAQLLFRCDV